MGEETEFETSPANSILQPDRPDDPTDERGAIQDGSHADPDWI